MAEPSQSRNSGTNAGNWMRLPHPDSTILSHRLLNAVRLYDISNSGEAARGMLKQAAEEVAAMEKALSAVSERGPLDAAGVEKLEPTFLEQIAIEALNEVKAWRDCDGNDGFPHSTREKVEAVLMTYEQRRIHRPLANERPEGADRV